MATDVDISNLALAHLGESATVSSIEPPDGSTQAGHCARFYPLARDLLQEAFPWSFCTRRITPATLDSESSAYAFAYQIPNDAVTIFSVLPPGADNDYVSQFNETILTAPVPELMNTQNAQRVPQNYALETLADGQKVIYTDVQDAVIRFGIRVTDTARFSTMYVSACSRLMASYMAGPIIKGRAGREEAKYQFGMFRQEFGTATTNDANQSKTVLNHVPSWMANR